MKKALLILLTILLVYFLISLYYLDKVYFLCPIEYKGNLIIRCDMRGNGFFAASRSGRRMHNGLDLFAMVGTPVLASRSGKVIAASQNQGMGNYIIIKHADNMVTIYGHLDKIYVVKNRFVRQGSVIGSVGKTGNANYFDIQPHLHLEVRKDGLPQDPLKYLE